MQGLRKFTMGIIFLIAAISLLVLGYIDGKDWSDGVSTVMVSFMGANLASKIANVAKEWLEKVKEKI